MKSEKGGTPNFKRSSPTSTLMKEGTRKFSGQWSWNDWGQHKFS